MSRRVLLRAAAGNPVAPLPAVDVDSFSKNGKCAEIAGSLACTFAS